MGVGVGGQLLGPTGSSGPGSHQWGFTVICHPEPHPVSEPGLHLGGDVCWVLGMGHSLPQGLSGDKVDPQRSWTFPRGSGMEVGRGLLLTGLLLAM